MANLEDQLGQVKTLFDRQTGAEVQDAQSKGQLTRIESAPDKRVSEDSFNVERFKDKLYNLSQTTAKDGKHGREKNESKAAIKETNEASPG